MNTPILLWKPLALKFNMTTKLSFLSSDFCGKHEDLYEDYGTSGTEGDVHGGTV